MDNIQDHFLLELHIMNHFSHTIGIRTYGFRDLKDLMAKATPARSGDYLAGVAASSAEERVAAQMTLAALPLGIFLQEVVIPEIILLSLGEKVLLSLQGLLYALPLHVSLLDLVNSPQHLFHG